MDKDRSEATTSGEAAAAIGHIAWVVPELRVVLGSSLVRERGELLSYVVLNDMSCHVRDDPALHSPYLAALEEVLLKTDDGQLNSDFSAITSPLWSLVNSGLRPIVDPFDDDQVQEFSPMLGPCLSKIVRGVQAWRP